MNQEKQINSRNNLDSFLNESKFRYDPFERTVTENIQISNSGKKNQQFQQMEDTFNFDFYTPSSKLQQKQRLGFVHIPYEKKEKQDLIVNHYGKKVILTNGYHDYLKTDVIKMNEQIKFNKLQNNNKNLSQNHSNSQYSFTASQRELFESKMREKFLNNQNKTQKQVSFRIDAIKNLPKDICQIKIEFCVEDSQGKLHYSAKGFTQQVIDPQFVNIGFRESFAIEVLDPEAHIYIEIAAKDSLTNKWFELWTLFPIYQRELVINQGMYKMPFYNLDFRPEQLYQNICEPVKNVKMFIRFSESFDSDYDFDTKKVDFQNYKIPLLHTFNNKREKEKIEKLIENNQNHKKYNQFKKMNFDVLSKRIENIKRIDNFYDGKMERDNHFVKLPQIHNLNNSVERFSNNNNSFKENQQDLNHSYSVQGYLMKPQIDQGISKFSVQNKNYIGINRVPQRYSNHNKSQFH